MTKLTQKWIRKFKKLKYIKKSKNRFMNLIKFKHAKLTTNKIKKIRVLKK